MSERPEEELRLIQPMSELRYLIADASSSRKSFRQLLTDFGIKASTIGTCSNIEESSTWIEAQRPNVIFADYSLEGGPVLSLLELQKKVVPANEPRLFFLATAKDSDTVVSGVADENVDGLFIKPFTFEQIRKTFVQVAIERISPEPRSRLIQTSRALIGQEQFELALKAAEAATQMDKSATGAWACHGQALLGLGRIQEAASSFEKALQKDPTHYRSLVGLLESQLRLKDHKRAYETGKRLSSAHTVPVKYIPELIRLSILNQQFGELMEFYSYADRISQLDPSLAPPLAAGLVVCGLHFLQNGRTAESLEAFRKAENADPKNLKIRIRILTALLSKGLEDETRVLLSRMPQEMREASETKLTLFEFTQKAGDSAQIVAEGMRLLQEGLRVRSVHLAIIHHSIRMGRQHSVIEDLVSVAIQDCPDDRALFEEILSSH